MTGQTAAAAFGLAAWKAAVAAGVERLERLDDDRSYEGGGGWVETEETRRETVEELLEAVLPHLGIPNTPAMAEWFSAGQGPNAAFAFATALGRSGALREQMKRAGWVNEMTTIPVSPETPIGGVLRRLDDVEGEAHVLVAVQSETGWDLVPMPKATRAATSD